MGMKRPIICFGMFGFTLCLSVLSMPCLESSSQALLATYTDSRSYSSVVWLTSHNSFTSSRDGWSYAQQTMTLEEQFDYGVRAFMLDLYLNPFENEQSIVLCHGECSARLPRITNLIPPTSLSVYLNKIHQFLQNNPNEIITLHLESYLREKGGKLLTDALEQTGLTRYLLPSTINPNDLSLTLGELRRKKHRLIIFSDNPRDKVINVGEYLETKYSLELYPNCEIREEGRANPGSKNLFLFNHFNTITRQTKLGAYEAINGYEQITQRINLCFSQLNRYPNFIAVDYVEFGNEGGARKVVLDLNRKSLEIECESKTDLVSSYGWITKASASVSALIPFLAHYKWSYLKKQRSVYGKQILMSFLSAPAFAHFALLIPYYCDFLPLPTLFISNSIFTSYASYACGRLIYPNPRK